MAGASLYHVRRLIYSLTSSVPYFSTLLPSIIPNLAMLFRPIQRITQERSLLKLERPLFLHSKERRTLKLEGGSFSFRLSLPVVDRDIFLMIMPVM
jgi:hypothetical protein